MLAESNAYTQTSRHSTNKWFRKYGESLAGQRSTSSPQKKTLRDALALDWPNLLLFAFPPIALFPQVIRRIWEQKHRVLSVAPLWRNQHWFVELVRLLTAAPWPILLRRDLLSQTNGTIWHPSPSYGSYIFGLLMGAFGPSQECAKYYFSG